MLKSTFARLRHPINTNDGTHCGLVRVLLAQGESCIGSIPPLPSTMTRATFVWLGKLRVRSRPTRLHTREPHILSGTHFEACFSLMQSVVVQLSRDVWAQFVIHARSFGVPCPQATNWDSNVVGGSGSCTGFLRITRAACLPSAFPRRHPRSRHTSHPRARGPASFPRHNDTQSKQRAG